MKTIKVEHKKDMLGKYTKETQKDGTVYIHRYFKELGLSVKVKEN